jgi:hypothetical protein
LVALTNIKTEDFYAGAEGSGLFEYVRKQLEEIVAAEGSIIGNQGTFVRWLRHL